LLAPDPTNHWPKCFNQPLLIALKHSALVATVEALTQAGLRPGPIELPGGPDGPQTSWLSDPDGYRIELVEWPPGHPNGITAADFP
jgi:lactoylglutathione lyase